jgi:glycine oxidase
MSSQDSQSVIVVGAGPVGLCCALALAKAGHRVRLIDNGARGAGWASGGMLGAVYETLGHDDVPQALTDFAFESLTRWTELATSLNIEVSKSSLFVALTEEEASNLEALAHYPEACMISVPVPNGIAGIGAWLCSRDASLDPRATLRALKAACVRAGVKLVLGEIDRISAGRLRLTNGKRVRADAIVLATGAALGALAHITPVKGQMLALASGPELELPQTIRAGRLYLLPRGDQIVVGATSNADDTDTSQFDLDAHKALHNEAIALWPKLAQAPLVESWFGFRPMTPDGLPLVGLTSLDGVYLATGTYRNGWLLAPAIADLVCDMVSGTKSPYEDLQLFSPQRFPNQRHRAKCPDKS